MSNGHNRIRLISLLVLLGVLVLCVGVTQARYITSVRGSLVFEADPLDDSYAISVHTADGWKVSGDGAVLEFALSAATTGNAERSACLRLTATEALDPGVIVTLTVNGTIYTGVRYPIANTDPLYDKMGSGTEFRFCDDNGERYWSLTDGQTMILTVQGLSEVALLRLTVTEI